MESAEEDLAAVTVRALASRRQSSKGEGQLFD